MWWFRWKLSHQKSRPWILVLSKVFIFLISFITFTYSSIAKKRQSLFRKGQISVSGSQVIESFLEQKLLKIMTNKTLTNSNCIFQCNSFMMKLSSRWFQNYVLFQHFWTGRYRFRYFSPLEYSTHVKFEALVQIRRFVHQIIRSTEVN